MSRRSTVNTTFQAETEAMEKIFTGSLNSKTSTTQLQKWVGQAIAETLTLGIWSIQYETESAAINDSKRQRLMPLKGAKRTSDTWKRA